MPRRSSAPCARPVAWRLEFPYIRSGCAVFTQGDARSKIPAVPYQRCAVSDKEQVVQTVRQPYAAPQLTRYGDLRYLTRAGSEDMMEDFMADAGHQFRMP